MSKTIGIVSLKGGVGKTSVVASLGAALADFNKKILLIDGNLSAPNLGLHLNMVEPPATLHHVLRGSVNIKDAVYPFNNFDVIPSSIFNKNNVNPLKLKDKIKSLKRKYDVILIDSSPALNDETLAVMLASDEIFVVTTPDVPTLSATIKAIRIAKKRGIPISGLILNKLHNKRFELSFEDIESTAGVPIMAAIPYDIAVLKSLASFTPFTLYKPNSEGSDEYRKLAAVLIGEKYKPVRLKSLFGWTSPKRQDINKVIFYEGIFK